MMLHERMAIGLLTVGVALIVFACGFAIDVFYVGWMRSVALGHPLVAALMSMCIGGCGLLGVTNVVRNKWLAIPYLAGLGVGTLVGMAL